jgi:hypothetical protein
VGSALLVVPSVLVACAVSAGPAAAADPAGYQGVRINEVTSSGDDTVELYNAGGSPVSLAGWKMADSVVLYTADGTVVDRVDWATGKAKPPAMARRADRRL